MQKFRAKTFSYEPDVPFHSGTITARCSKVWCEMLAFAFDAGRTADDFDLVIWELADSGDVRVTFRASNTSDLARPGRTVEGVFHVQNIANELEQSKAAEGKKVQASYYEWIISAIAESFLSEPVEIEMSYFNQGEHPFSVLVTGKDVGLLESQLKLVISEKGGLDEKEIRRKQDCLLKGKEFRPRAKGKRRIVKAKKKPSPPVLKTQPLKTFGPRWRRFYFDDGQTRKYWYIQTQAKTQTIMQGAIGKRGSVRKKNFTSNKEARQHSSSLCDKKIKAGFIEYCPNEIEYRQKNRRAIKLIQQALKDFKKANDYIIPEEFLGYILEVNGGSPEPDWITLPGHADYQKVQVGGLLGFRPGQMVDDIDYHVSSSVLPAGHIPLASGLHLFTVDQLGAIHFWDERKIQPNDVSDDNRVHYDRMESFLVANSVDEFLTRISKFPHDTQIEVDYKSPEQNREEIAKRRSEALKKAVNKSRRKFFFDDGVTRKYWNIHLQKNEHTTRYAKYGTRPGETTKSFESNTSAAKSAAKLIGQKLKKGYVEIVPEALTVARTHGQGLASEAMILKFEKKLGVELPKDYRNFLKTQNGGFPEPNFIKITGVPYIDNVDVGYLMGLYFDGRPGECLTWGIESVQKCLPKGHLPIGGKGDIFSISLGRNFGSVYFWDHESNEISERTEKFHVSAGHLLTHSFDEFLTRISLYSSDT